MTGAAGTPDVEHVVLVSIDTLRADAVASSPVKLWPAKYDVDVTLAPSVLDELAGRGTWFARCLSAAPYTPASHGTYLTGRWPRAHGLYELFNRRLAVPTLFELARDAGYRTVMKVDFPLMLGEELGFTRAVDRYLVEDDPGAVAAIGPEPTFALVHFSGAHTPYGFHNLRLGGQAFVDKVRELEGEIGGAPPGHLGATDVDLQIRYRRVLQRLYRDGRYDRLFALYLEGVNRFLTGRFARFVDDLDARLAGTRSLLVVFGDHGEEYDRYAYGHQNSVAEGVLRVPLLFVGDGVGRACRLDQVRTVDVAPTVLELTGIRAGGLRLDGRSLAALLTAAEPGGDGAGEAFAQSWMPDSAAYLRAVRDLAVHGERRGTLPHQLVEEVAYRGDLRLFRRLRTFVARDDGWALEPCGAGSALERHTGGGWQPVGDPLLHAALAERLDAYGRSGPTGAEPADLPEVDPVLRERLQAMGYDI